MPVKLNIQTIKAKNVTEIYITAVPTLPLAGNTQNQELFCGTAEALRQILSWRADHSCYRGYLS
jgi:hypothetical protein